MPQFSRWFPSKEQLKDPESLELTLRQILTQHYALVDKFNKGSEKESNPEKETSKFPPGSGPSNTVILGLHVEPVDTQTLTNGATLKYNKARGTFSFQ